MPERSRVAVVALWRAAVEAVAAVLRVGLIGPQAALSIPCIIKMCQFYKQH